MPLYEYRCAACGAQSEILVRGSETPVCPECESPKLEKLFSTFAPLASSGDKPACPEASPCCTTDRCRSGMCGLGQ